MTRRAQIARDKTLQKALIDLHGALETEEFVDAVFRIMQATAPSYLTCVTLRYTEGNGAVWYDSVGRRMEAESMIGLFRDHPCYDAIQPNPGLKMLPTKGVLPEGQALLDLEFYQKFMVPMGWRHATGLNFWDAPALEDLDFVFSLLRSEAEGDFSAEENKKLLKFHAPIDRARRRLRRLQAERAEHRSLEAFVRNLPMAVALVSWHLKPIYFNREACELAARWNRGSASSALRNKRADFRLPAALVEAATSLKKEQKGLLLQKPVSRQKLKRVIAHPHDNTLRAHLTTMPVEASVLVNPSFFIQFELVDPASPTPATELRSLDKLSTLTRSERSIALLIREGHSNQEIALKLSKSLATVKTELHTIFGKLNVRSRGQLAALLR